MKFSIILPVRNGGEYVKECVASILSQTYSEFTLHVLDNNSTDGTFEWLDALHDSRIEITPSSTLLTIEENWARALTVKKNEFMTLIGHDDRLLPNYLQVMNNLINQYPDASLYQAHFNYIDSFGKFVRVSKKMAIIQTAEEFLACHINQSLDSMGTGYMMRTKDYEKLGGIPTNYPALLFADYELWIRLISISYKATSPLTLFEYRLHESTSKSANAVVYQNAFMKYIEFLIKLNKEQVEFKSVIKNQGLTLIKYYCKSLSHRMLRIPKSQRVLSVADFVFKCKILSKELLGPENYFKPFHSLSIIIAILIDNSDWGLYLFSKYRYWKYEKNR